MFGKMTSRRSGSKAKDVLVRLSYKNSGSKRYLSVMSCQFLWYIPPPVKEEMLIR